MRAEIKNEELEKTNQLRLKKGRSFQKSSLKGKRENRNYVLHLTM